MDDVRAGLAGVKAVRFAQRARILRSALFGLSWPGHVAARHHARAGAAGVTK